MCFFSCNSTPRSGCSALHGVNPNLKKKKKSINNNGRHLIIQKCFTMILGIIKYLFDLEITYKNKNASTEIQQSLLNDNFTMHTSCSIVTCVYNHIEIQSKTLLNLQLFLCIVSSQMETEYIAKFSIWISIFLFFYFHHYYHYCHYYYYNYYYHL